ncbi:alpha-L-fucosidase [Polaribacter sp. IC073]|uniref:alpha-L-fucosidase n=1 Tax=Polaribacter sp. IC073 TaxID=2508540 RepID=UPI0011BF6E5A|nr:alpha-L-fucosidase [Polaribacter sp. IC073]TXD46371.1 alpha-L-fucosidase [Polaribacter sp. IC073]
MKLNTFIIFIVCFLSFSCYAQDKELSWKELGENYEFPEWYTEARFGIWVHWGAQTEPLQGGGWYARHMYMEDVGKEKWGRNAYSYHKNKFGHPSEIGFKDVLNEWKAEKLDTDALVRYFKSIGAKYFVALANHHDHFDNFDSTHHPWNSVNMGPKRDIIGEFEKSTKKYEMPFGVSSHDDRFLGWWLPAFGADTAGPHKGVLYDGHMTVEDGKGKWWEGLDPADLYGLPPAERTPEYIEKVKQNWMLRHKELVTKYDIDMIWFDGYNFPYNEYGKEVCETFFNNKRDNTGKINAVVAGKFHNEPSTVKDIERGGASEILPYPWQGITTLRTWFYKEDTHAMDYRHSAKTVIETLADYNSKNGNLLLNVELLGDGTIPTTQKIILDEVGAWIHQNSEAIYASKPWKIYGDNLNSYLKVLEESGIGEADLEALKKQKSQEHFNERTLKSTAYGSDEVRFTTNGNVLYMFVLNPSEGKIEIPSLGLHSKQKPGKISSIEIIGSDAHVEFKQGKKKLMLIVPAKRPNKLTTVFRIKGVL